MHLRGYFALQLVPLPSTYFDNVVKRNLLAQLRALRPCPNDDVSQEIHHFRQRMRALNDGSASINRRGLDDALCRNTLSGVSTTPQAGVSCAERGNVRYINANTRKIVAD